MAPSCRSSRCTKCGKQKRTVYDDGFLMQDIDLIDRDGLDAFWSPLESSKAWPSIQQVSADSPSPAKRTIIIDLVTRDDEPENSLASQRKAKGMRQQNFRNHTISRRRHLSMSRLMQNFARGMASAFGTTVTSRPRTVGKKFYLNDFDLDDSKVLSTFPPGVLPSATQIRRFFSRLGGKLRPLSPEQRPFAADYQEALTTYHQTVPTSFRLQVY